MKQIEKCLLEASLNFHSEKNLWKQLPVLMDIITADGASFLLKSDGERESDVYTFLIQGGPLGDDYIRFETSDLMSGIQKVFSEYSIRF